MAGRLMFYFPCVYFIVSHQANYLMYQCKDFCQIKNDCTFADLYKKGH